MVFYHTNRKQTKILPKRSSPSRDISYSNYDIVCLLIFFHFYLTLLQDADIHYYRFCFPLLDSTKISSGFCLPLSDIPGKLPEWISLPAFWSLKILLYQRKLQTGRSILNYFSPIHYLDSDKHLGLGQNHLCFRNSVLHLLHNSFIQLKRLMPLLFSFFFSFFFYHNYSKCLKNTRWDLVNSMFFISMWVCMWL